MPAERVADGAVAGGVPSEPAGDAQVRAGDVARLARQQPGDGTGDLVGLTGSTHRDGLGDLRRTVRVPMELGPDRSGRHGVHPDAGRELLRQPDRERVDAGLRRCVLHVRTRATKGGGC